MGVGTAMCHKLDVGPSCGICLSAGALARYSTERLWCRQNVTVSKLKICLLTPSSRGCVGYAGDNRLEATRAGY
jgi:hypothetical protein